MAEGVIDPLEMIDVDESNGQVRARAAGHRICEVPVRHYPRKAGAPTGANLKVIRKAFRELWDLRKELR